MSVSNVLVIATVVLDWSLLREHAPELALPDGASVRVVSPTSRLSRAQWLTNEEDAAREEAAKIATDVAAAVDAAPETETEVETEVGDVDPLQAAEDALATFPADELVVLIRAEDQASWLERAAAERGFERFGLPVRYVVVDGAPS
jgi:hypothetical protein